MRAGQNPGHKREAEKKYCSFSIKRWLYWFAERVGLTGKDWGETVSASVTYLLPWGIALLAATAVAWRMSRGGPS